jgi:hypothetical protein
MHVNAVCTSYAARGSAARRARCGRFQLRTVAANTLILPKVKSAYLLEGNRRLLANLLANAVTVPDMLDGPGDAIGWITAAVAVLFVLIVLAVAQWLRR